MKPHPAGKERVPRAVVERRLERVTGGECVSFHVGVTPCRTLKQARALAKVANMSRQEVEQYAFKVMRKTSPHVSKPWQRMAAGIFADIVTDAIQLGDAP